MLKVPVEVERRCGSKDSTTAVMLVVSCVCDVDQMWKGGNRSTKATRRQTRNEKMVRKRLVFYYMRIRSFRVFSPQETGVMSTSDRNDLPNFITLQTQPFLLVARGLVKVSRRVLVASIATKAGVLIAVLAWRSPVMRGWASFRVDLDLSDSPLGHMDDVRRTTRGRKVSSSSSEDENRKVECK